MADLANDRNTIPRVITILSSLLQRVANLNDSSQYQRLQKPAKSLLDSAFRSHSKPPISIQNYLGRIFKYSNCSSSCFVVAFVYLDRFVGRHPSVAIDSFNVHRFIITSVLTAVKFVDDVHYNNKFYAKLGGISLAEMNFLEVGFLFGVGFELNVTPSIFTSYCSILQNEMFVDCPPPPQRLPCSVLEEESSGSCQNQQRQSAKFLAIS